MDYKLFFKSCLDTIKNEGRYRVFASLERLQGDFPYARFHTPEGIKKVIVWCGNDYLGMGQHPDVLKEMKAALDQCGAGAGGTRNISGTNIHHVTLEKELADLHDREAALVFTSGYVANEATLSTLGRLLPNCLYFSDSDNHASMIQGIQHSRADKIIFRHNDLAHLRQSLEAADPSRPKVIAFESVYSMDGDIAPIEAFCDLADEFDALTYLDEVHGVGMYGHKGGGIAQELGLSHRLDIIQGTLGKAFGVVGGYIAGDRDIIDFIRSFAAGFIFTTSIAPAIAAGAISSLRHLKKSETERNRQKENTAYLKTSLDKLCIPFLRSQSHIVPVVIGEAHLCQQVSKKLLDTYNIYSQPINYPTVPIGTERLRLTPSALHTRGMIDILCQALDQIWGDLALPRSHKMAA